MAMDLGELMVPYMPTIRVPRTGDRVFKSECAFSYDTPESEGGLYVCMNTFLGFGREHVERHYRKTGQSVYLHLKRTVKEVEDAHLRGLTGNGPALSLARSFWCVSDKRALSRVAGIIPERRSDSGTMSLEITSTCFCRVTIACDAMLNAPSPYRKPEPLPWDDEIQVSKHSRGLLQQDSGVRIPPSGWKCSRCEMRENLWLNLTDGAVLCGKWFFDGTGGNGHALEHYRETGFPLAVKLDTITPDGADVYSFDEEEAVVDPRLADHLAHFGIDVLQKKKKHAPLRLSAQPESGRTGGELQPHLSEWELVQESGRKLKAVYGSGYTGIKNLGNSSYLGATMQVLFSIPEFQRAYVGNLQRIFDYSPLDPTRDFHTQMMFKALIGAEHPEFSSNRQQDALQFLRHLVSIVERNSASPESPADVFRFLVEERTQCCQSGKVRYAQRPDHIMQLPVPVEAATNREELLEYEVRKREAEENRMPPPPPVRARVPFTVCLQAFTEPENVPDFWSSALQAKSAGIKTSRFATFPDYLVVQIKKFSFGVDWIPKKLDVSVEMPDFLDLSRLRGTGLQAGEEVLPDLAPPIITPEDPIAPEIDESSVMQLAEMGFPLEACRKAVYYTGNMGAEMAFSWILAHMEEPDFAEPLAVSGSAQDNPPTRTLASFLASQPPEESVAIVTSMGFPRQLAIQALQATNNNLERALDWIFTHPDGAVESEHSAPPAERDPPAPRVKDGPGRYELFAFISHMGPSTMSGHYVCHIKKEGRWVIYNDHKVCLSEKPPKNLGYIYFYQRLSHS
uniref:Ubiquitin carboxyl-terminal hydrolase n=1 Tax=Scleropages formosus TaxID=113540 RepID=A0A8C9T8K8_SCLFO